jgi:hypothetical protein
VTIGKNHRTTQNSKGNDADDAGDDERPLLSDQEPLIIRADPEDLCA